MTAFARYDTGQLQQLFRKKLTAQVQAGRMTEEIANRLADEYAKAAGRTTYLE